MNQIIFLISIIFLFSPQSYAEDTTREEALESLRAYEAVAVRRYAQDLLDKYKKEGGLEAKRLSKILEDLIQTGDTEDIKTFINAQRKEEECRKIDLEIESAKTQGDQEDLFSAFLYAYDSFCGDRQLLAKNLISIIQTNDDIYLSDQSFFLESAIVTNDRATFNALISIVGKEVINYRAHHGRTALIFAAKGAREDIPSDSCYPDIVKDLISAGAELDHQDRFRYNRTALMWAVNRGCIKTVKALIEAGADLDIKDERGNTAFVLSWKDGYQKSDDYIQELLIEAGAKLPLSYRLFGLVI